MPTEMSWPAFSSSVIFFNCSSAHLRASLLGRDLYVGETWADMATRNVQQLWFWRLSFRAVACGRTGLTSNDKTTGSRSATRGCLKTFLRDIGNKFLIVRMSVGRTGRQLVLPLGRCGREGEAREPRDEERDAAPQQHVPRPRERRVEAHVEHDDDARHHPDERGRLAHAPEEGADEEDAEHRPVDERRDRQSLVERRAWIAHRGDGDGDLHDAPDERQHV